MATTISQGRDTPHVLYTNLYSICSIMVRYTLAVRGVPQTPASALIVEEREVDIFRGQQFEEQFLLEVNPKGQVPVLTSTEALANPIADSLEITFYIAGRYPNLLPLEHKGEIIRLLHDLHAVNYYSLSFAGKEHVPASAKSVIVKRMEDPNTSQRHRDALAYKLSIHEREKIGGLVSAEVESNIAKARILLLELHKLLAPTAGPWLFGAHVPTALDAHLVAFLARLRDIGRHELIPEGLTRYAEMATKTPAWQGVMSRRRTVPDGWK